MIEKKHDIDRRHTTRTVEFPLKLPFGETVSVDRRRSFDRRVHGYLSNHPFCCGVPYGALEPLLVKCSTFPLEKGAVLLSPGQENHNLYLLLEGQLKVHLEALGSEAGILIEPGECAGEISIIDGKRPTAYVAAEKPSRILAIPEDILWSEFFQIPGIARNFMRQLAERFRKRNAVMQIALEQALRLENLQKELSIARDLQASMLPRRVPLFPNHPQVDVAATMWPAKEVGGDFYDAYPLDDRRIAIAIGDVSGKGVPAALFMVRAMTLLRGEMTRDDDLSRIIGRVNRLLCEDNVTCMFVTLLVVVLDVVSGEYALVNGGHNRPLIGPRGERYRYLDLPKGILLGVEVDVDYELDTGRMKQDDVLVLFTDGVTEARSPAGDFYTQERLVAHLNRLQSTTATGLAKEIVEEVDIFSGGAISQSDDITVVVLRYPGPAKSG